MNNTLEPTRGMRQRFWKRNAPQPLVTIAIGLISKRSRWGDGEIILASDSQLTFVNGPKDLHAEKLSAVQFRNGKLLMVHSGFVQPALKSVQAIRRLAEVESIENAERVIEQGMRETRAALLGGLGLSEEREKTYLQLDNKHDFLIAFFVNGQPRLRYIDNYRCTVFPVEHQDYGAIGTGDYLALYLLKEHRAADPGFEFSDSAAISIIERVKDNVDGCGGACQLGIVLPLEKQAWHCDILIYPKHLVDTCSVEMRQLESRLSTERAAQLNAFMHIFWKGIGGGDTLPGDKPK